MDEKNNATEDNELRLKQELLEEVTRTKQYLLELFEAHATRPQEGSKKSDALTAICRAWNATMDYGACLLEGDWENEENFASMKKALREVVKSL